MFNKTLVLVKLGFKNTVGEIFNVTTKKRKK